MARLEPLPIDTKPELAEHFRFFVGTLGSTPNSASVVQRRPKLVRALAQMNAAVMIPRVNSISASSASSAISRATRRTAATAQRTPRSGRWA